ncbi:MAG: NADH:ubiquinone oxidoreductase [Proteobacteria bacterium]|nr:NADH:ubiquinone oxidoreductase [Pseudomonadota bacterium]NCA27849.1 NADH:ubiquinone oxidoreductase [Pseudomonadota bacterium]
MRAINNFLIKFNSKKIGTDEFGNQYFEKKSGKRFVIYNGIAEPTKIPSEWHVWIHYLTNQAPVQINTNKYSWQKIHIPNLTGTKNAYSPEKTNLNKTYLHYEPWEAN